MYTLAELYSKAVKMASLIQRTAQKRKNKEKLKSE